MYKSFFDNPILRLNPPTAAARATGVSPVLMRASPAARRPLPVRARHALTGPLSVGVRSTLPKNCLGSLGSVGTLGSLAGGRVSLKLARVALPERDAWVKRLPGEIFVDDLHGRFAGVYCCVVWDVFVLESTAGRGLSARRVAAILSVGCAPIHPFANPLAEGRRTFPPFRGRDASILMYDRLTAAAVSITVTLERAVRRARGHLRLAVPPSGSARRSSGASDRRNRRFQLVS